MKLSKRLQQLDQMVTTPYQHIWDCCCDHGLLGMTLLARSAAPNIHFVDIVPELMLQLNSKLTQFFPHSTSTWASHCIDVKKLPLMQYPLAESEKHLVIIAGVGGDLMTEFIEGICVNNPNLNIDFLLCPVHHQFSLRAKLITLNFSLLDEVLLEENQRFYEMLLVSSNATQGDKISPIGDKIWHSDSVEQRTVINNYLVKTLKHYQRIQQDHSAQAERAIEHYQAQANKLNAIKSSK
ncbi:tRNA (adenine(22)-N(1))-methyltransferase TrmK [Colwellia asteriadis]|uniref:tRNA (Adenine(22)-N(1))-methyltransferase TrmK n=1 Tax=Colwellia asteriadis TaxID=517723 RepID=A0ABN1L2U5_9GAMM